MNKSVEAQCSSCDGTGLYCGMCEPEHTAVVCLDCSGTGKETISYTTYTGRRRKRGIREIRPSRGRFLIGPMGGGDAPPMTYSEFERLYPAKRCSK